MAVDSVPVVIIGGGPSGVCAAIQLSRQIGLDYVLFEKSAQIGGTWHDNRYPGAECDVPSHLYSFSFDCNMGWSKKYSSAPEINAYFIKLAEGNGVLSHARMSTAVTGVVWNDASRRWLVSYSSQGKSGAVSAKYVISCVGALHVPRLPDIPGVGSFRGRTLHTAQWDESVPLDGKTVAIIGTGASTVQVLPSVAARLRGAYVFQRSAAWVVPRGNFSFPAWVISVFTAFPLLAWLYRWLTYLVMELVFFGIIRTPAFALLRRVAISRANTHRKEQLAGGFVAGNAADAAAPAAPGSCPFLGGSGSGTKGAVVPDGCSI